MGAVESKTCIEPGGAGSLGLASVRALLAEGAKVMLVDLDADRLESTVRELGTHRAAFVAADVTDAAQTRKYVGDTVARWRWRVLRVNDPRSRRRSKIASRLRWEIGS